jgi:hypothetical protein
MVAAMAALDAEGLFGTGPERHRVFINVEVAPRDDTNVARAVLLNPAEAALPGLRMWAIPPRSAAWQRVEADKPARLLQDRPWSVLAAEPVVIRR